MRSNFRLFLALTNTAELRREAVEKECFQGQNNSSIEANRRFRLLLCSIDSVNHLL